MFGFLSWAPSPVYLRLMISLRQEALQEPSPEASWPGWRTRPAPAPSEGWPALSNPSLRRGALLKHACWWAPGGVLTGDPLPWAGVPLPGSILCSTVLQLRPPWPPQTLSRVSSAWGAHQSLLGVTAPQPESPAGSKQRAPSGTTVLRCPVSSVLQTVLGSRPQG